MYLNLETGKSFNGWPLGLEAVTQGCVLITTDPLNSQELYNIEEDIFLVCNNTEDFINKIHELVNDRPKMNLISEKAKNFLEKHITKNNQQKRVLEFMKKIKNSVNSETIKLI